MFVLFLLCSQPQAAQTQTTLKVCMTCFFVLQQPFGLADCFKFEGFLMLPCISLAAQQSTASLPADHANLHKAPHIHQFASAGLSNLASCLQNI